MFNKQDRKHPLSPADTTHWTLALEKEKNKPGPWQGTLNGAPSPHDYYRALYRLKGCLVKHKFY